MLGLTSAQHFIHVLFRSLHVAGCNALLPLTTRAFEICQPAPFLMLWQTLHVIAQVQAIPMRTGELKFAFCGGWLISEGHLAMTVLSPMNSVARRSAQAMRDRKHQSEVGNPLPGRSPWHRMQFSQSPQHMLLRDSPAGIWRPIAPRQGSIERRGRVARRELNRLRTMR